MQDVLNVQSVRAVRSVRSVPRGRDGGRQGCSSDRVKSHIAYTAILRTVHAYSDLIVKTGVQDALDDNNAAADFYAALDEEVADLLEDAARRDEANDRKTVEPCDL